MTHIEANKLIDACHSIASCDGNAKITAQLLDEAAQALHKQVPTKPEIKGRDELRMCSLCNAILSGAKYPYCQYCGQALDWSEL